MIETGCSVTLLLKPGKRVRFLRRHLIGTHKYTSDSALWNTLEPRGRQMRHVPTFAEEVLWQHLRNRRTGGAKFRRQHAIAVFIVDFVSIEKRLIVEVDELIHTLPDQQACDQQRQEALEALHFRVLRFTNANVLQATANVLNRIGEVLAE